MLHSKTTWKISSRVFDIDQCAITAVFVEIPTNSDDTINLPVETENITISEDANLFLTRFIGMSFHFCISGHTLTMRT